MAYFHMSIYMTRMSTFVRTVIAFIWFFSSMCPDVIRHFLARVIMIVTCKAYILVAGAFFND